MTDPLRRLMPVVRLAPAKLNLTVAILGRRPDGFHDLHSIMVPLALADRLSLSPTTGSDDSLHVEGFDPGPPADNLVIRAIAATRAALMAAAPLDRLAGRVSAGSSGQPAVRAPASGSAMPLATRLEKRIPVAAGLGGGSSDAAAAIDGALEAWGAALDDDTRTSIGARLGSDVPFCLVGRIALVEGRGERVTPLAWPTGEPPGVLLATPALRIATSDAYAAFATGIRPAITGAARATSQHLASELGRGLGTADLLARAAAMASANDLLPASLAVLPGLLPFRRGLARLLGRPVGVTGSGPTCWVLYPSIAEAEAAAAEITDAVAGGRLPSPGDDPPIVLATTFATGGRPTRPETAPGGGTT